jgi:hypothetical protein
VTIAALGPIAVADGSLVVSAHTGERSSPVGSVLSVNPGCTERPVRWATLSGPDVDDGESAVKKGRHRRYEEARNLKRGPDLDIEALFTDLGGEPATVAAAVEDIARDDVEYDPDASYLDDLDEDDDDEY